MHRKNWELTAESWNGFLAMLDSDRNSAGDKYEAFRSKLITFFRARDCEPAEDWADETLDRVIRRSQESTVANLASFTLGVARRVAAEAHRAVKTEPLAETLAARRDDSPGEEDDAPLRACLAECLQDLSAPERDLLIRYYQSEKTTKIQNKRDMAEALGISATALRVRVFRVRRQLQVAVHKGFRARRAAAAV